MIGKTVSHYRILEKIGEGGMGEVYVAEDSKLQRKVALKFLPENLTRDPSRKQRFLQEARAAAALEHPHIAAVYDIDEVDGRTFIVMEYVRGASLRQAIGEGKLTLRRSLELGCQIAEALAKAHERGIVHRDLKPENVLLTEDGFAKIIDFGLAKLGESPRPDDVVESEAETLIKTQDGLLMGTVAYMSPEQARAKAVDARTDVFSVGVVLHEMLTGSSPFQRDSVAETLSAILKEGPSRLPEEVVSVAPELPSVLRKALAKDPDSRYARMRELADDLRGLREELGSGARPSLAPSFWGRSIRNGAFVGGVLVVVIATVFLLRRDAQPTGIGPSGRPAIAVMYFEDNTGSEEIRWLARGLPNMLITDLAQTPGLDVVSRQRILEILKQVGEDELEAIDASLVPEIARRAGAGAVVGGSIYKMGDQIRIDVQVEDVGSGRILSAHSVRGQDVFPLVDELTGRIRDSLNMADAPLERGIAEVTTASLEAYRHYVEGLEASRNFRWADARSHLERAVEIDPSFAVAQFELFRLAPLWGDEASVDQYREKVSEHLDRLPERQRLFIEAVLARQDNKPERARDLLEELLSRYPDEADAYTALSVIYNGPLNQPQKALETAARGTAAVPMAGTVHNQYGYYLIYAGRYDEGFRQLETYAELDPEEPNPFDSLGEANLFTGQPEKALESYGKALEVDPSFFNAHTGRAWAFAMLGRYDEARKEVRELGQAIADAGFNNLTAAVEFVAAFVDSRVGRYREAADHIARGLELAEDLDQIEAKIPLHLLAASLALERKDYAGAGQEIDRVWELLPEVASPQARQAQSLYAELIAGAAEARSGDLEAARARLETEKERFDPERYLENWTYRALEGEIALLEGDLDRAEQAFLAAEPDIKMHLHMTAPVESLAANNPPLRDGLARVEEARGNLAGAIAAYQELLTPDASRRWTSMLEPRYVLKLARLLDKSGDTEAARAQYQRFLDLWKDADPDLPELAEAQAYLDRTQTSS